MISATQAGIEAVFREESGRILAGLMLTAGSMDRAEDALQEALAQALTVWPEQGTPANPAAWLTTVARRKLIDQIRRRRTRQEKLEQLRYQIELNASLPAPDEIGGTAAEDTTFPDERLRLIFTCCHPALDREAQVALTLRTLGGLTTWEIAKAFLVPEATLAQRIVRAKRRLTEQHIPYEVPQAEQLEERVAAVRAVIYLIFNEGYAAAAGDNLLRLDLCREAIRLARLLQQLQPAPETAGLLALLLLQHSRAAARVRGTGDAAELVTLEEQDRALWDQALIAEGVALLETTLRASARREVGSPVGPYLIQAAIAALHAQAPSPAATDWAQIAALYERLQALDPSPVIALNQAVAQAMAYGPEAGLERMRQLQGLDNYYLLHAARADLLRRLARPLEAAPHYQRALELATNAAERGYLERRLRECGA